MPHECCDHVYIFCVTVRCGGDGGDKALPEEEKKEEEKEKEDINKLRASARNNSLGIVPLNRQTAE